MIEWQSIQKEIDAIRNDCIHLKAMKNVEQCLPTDRHCMHYCSVHDITYCCGGDVEIQGRHVQSMNGGGGF